MSEHVEILFKLRENEQESGLLETIVAAFRKKGYSVSKDLCLGKWYDTYATDFEDYKFSFGISKPPWDPKELFIHLSSPEGYFNYGIEEKGQPEYLPDDEVLRRNLKFIEVGKDLYDIIHPLYGFGGSHLSLDPFYWDFKGCAAWLNFFGPELVKKYGKEKLLSTPVKYRAEELSDGGVLVAISKQYNKASEVFKRMMAEHVGFLDEYMKKRKEYSVKFGGGKY